MTTIWSTDNHIRHPWFDPRGQKRRRISPHSSSDESDAPLELLHPVKRRRCSVLEQGFAHLSLQHKVQNDNSFVKVQDTNTSALPQEEECAMDTDDAVGGGHIPHLLPGSIEEPEQEIPEIDMKISSWYELEPDRIVITDLDSFESEEDNVGESESVSVNTSLLEHIKKKRGLLIPGDQPCQALVLYRPLPPLPDSSVGPRDRTEANDAETPMDVEI